MKKYIAILIALIMVFSLTGCGLGVTETVRAQEANKIDNDTTITSSDGPKDSKAPSYEEIIREADESRDSGIGYDMSKTSDWGMPDIVAEHVNGAQIRKDTYHKDIGIDVIYIQSEKVDAFKGFYEENNVTMPDQLWDDKNMTSYFVKDGISVQLIGNNGYYSSAIWEKDGMFYGVYTTELSDGKDALINHLGMFINGSEEEFYSDYYDSDILVLTLEDGCDYTDVEAYLKENGFEILTRLSGINAVVIRTPFVIGGYDFFSEYRARLEANSLIVKVNRDLEIVKDDVAFLNGDLINGVPIYVIEEYVDIFWN